MQVDLGQSIALGSIVLHPCKDDFNGIGEGFGFPARFKIELSDDAEFKTGVLLVADQTREDFPNPRLQAQGFEASGKTARHLRVTATRLAPRQNDYIFALAELEALTTEGRNAALGGSVTSLDSIEAPARWQRRNLTDGWYPGVSATNGGEVVALRRERTNLIDRVTTPDERKELASLDSNLAALQTTLAKLPAPSTAYIGAVHHGSGSFRGTGPDGGRPRPIFLLQRGNVQTPAQEVPPGALSCVAGLPSRFESAATGPEGERRAALARWLTDANNPLTWRSIVNRVWQYHFGRGLVETPNDFGRMGTPPSHPELLDWLAAEFRDGGQSIKQLHKLILTSAAYRQSSSVQREVAEKASALDADNRLLWRQNRRKLEAEAVRDSVLLVAGKLDFTMGGPSFQDFVIEKPEHSPHYQYHLHDPEDPRSHRRSIYRFVVRSQQQPFMTVLDCADPSMQVARRNESVSPLQALTLMNNAMMISMSRHFAARLDGGGGDIKAKVRRAYTEAIGHAPSVRDLKELETFARVNGLPNLCRVLFNLNEFNFVD